MCPNHQTPPNKILQKGFKNQNDYFKHINLNTVWTHLFGGVKMAETKTKHKNTIGEFFEFLKEYNVITLAIAFIMGVAATTLIKSLVDNIIMPIVGFLVPNGAWKEFVLQLGPILFKIGAFVGDLINFVIIALVVFVIAKYIMKEEKVTKK
jgi:large conductance mechanosensitive channel